MPNVAGDRSGELSLEVALGALDLGPERKHRNREKQQTNKKGKSTQLLDLNSTRQEILYKIVGLRLQGEPSGWIFRLGLL